MKAKGEGFLIASTYERIISVVCACTDHDEINNLDEGKVAQVAVCQALEDRREFKTGLKCSLTLRSARCN